MASSQLLLSNIITITPHLNVRIYLLENVSLDGKEMHLAGIVLNQQMFPVFWGLLLFSAVAWLFISNRFYTYLKMNHSEVFDGLGKPRLFMKKSMASNYRVIMYLLRREFETTDDAKVIRLSQGLRYIFIIFVINLLGCLVLLIYRLF